MPDTIPASPLDVSTLRAEEFPELSPGYLNAASFTPLPTRSRRAIEEFNLLRTDPCALSDEALVRTLERARGAAARLIGADPQEIALGWNTSFGINLAALALPIRTGSTVVVSDREFPSNVYPWMATPGATLEIVPTDQMGRPDEARLLERLDRGDVSVFALSSVQFSTGFRADLERFGRFCRERDIFFVVDAIQSLGQLPLDVRAASIDILATGGQKWLCAPFGTGFAYVRRELLQRMDPVLVGWTGMTASSDLASLTDYRWGLRPDARRFEVATLPFHDFAGFSTSVELLLEVGLEQIAAHTQRLLAPVIEWVHARDDVDLVSATDPRNRSAILAFRTPGSERVVERLQAAGVTCGRREGSIRLSPHFYSDEADVAIALEVLEASSRDGWT